MSNGEVFTAALALRPRARGELIALLLQSLEEDAGPPFENASTAELKRRMASQAHRPAEQVFKRARARLKR